MQSLPVLEDSTVLNFLLGRGYSKTKIKQLLKYRAVQLDGSPVSRLESELKAGATLTLTTEKEAAERPEECPDLTIVYEDDDILVIDKPAGLLTIASASEKKKTVFYKVSSCLSKRSKDKDRGFIVHRLDQGASGLLLFAKNEKTQHALQKAWSEVEKQFLVVVEGQLQPEKGTVKNYLCESKIHRMYASGKQTNGSKYAETSYRVLRSTSAYSLVEVTLVTARKNQLRVHMSDLGHPVVGDKKYGSKEDPIKRLAVHASLLRFPHPTTGETMELTLPLPQKIQKLLRTEEKSTDS
nr:RluA family pseudouridine synthase [uncultured Desulfobulbus sp.]